LKNNTEIRSLLNNKLRVKKRLTKSMTRRSLLTISKLTKGAIFLAFVVGKTGVNSDWFN